MNDYNKNYRPFYEQIWCIVAAFIICWPLGILFLVMKLMRDQELKVNVGDPFNPNNPNAVNRILGKRSCRTIKIWGWILICVGVFAFFGMMDSYYTETEFLAMLVSIIGMVIAGVILLITAKRKVAKWDRYDSFINKKGNTSLAMIAEKTGTSLKAVRRDIQTMVNNGFFVKPEKNIEAYIHGEYDLLVMTKDGEPMQEIKPPKPTAASAKPGQATGISPGQTFLMDLHEEIDRTTDPEFKATLWKIDSSIMRIEDKLAEEPELAKITAVKKLYESYLPQTMEFIRKFNDEEGSEETRWDIKKMIETCATAFKNIEGKVYEREDIDTKVDMEVLRKTLEREGYLNSDFDLTSKPEKAAEPEETAKAAATGDEQKGEE
ncbi:MAG: hypothetical protein Q4D99_00200 [Bacillota bacterium]|nr:hypothetical protein [Bacillota bacterium]